MKVGVYVLAESQANLFDNLHVMSSLRHNDVITAKASGF